MSTILLIDDDPDFVDGARILLEDEGFEVESAGTAAEGLQKVRDSEPDLIVLDVMMETDYEGFEVARTIREELKLTALPIIILSGVRATKNIPYHFAPDEHYLPIDIFLDKGVQPQTLVRMIRETLSEQRDTPQSPL